MTLSTRRLGPDDSAAVHDASVALGVEAFGSWPAHLPRPSAPAPGAWPDGVAMWATFDEAHPDPATGEPPLVARVRTHDYTSWFGGAAIPTSGYAGVAVAVEHRGAGLLADLFRASLTDLVAEGAVLSSLFPTAPGIYRRLGYETVTALDELELPAASLSGLRPEPEVRLRRAGLADLPAVAATYDAWARLQNGPLTRRGPLFRIEKLLNDVTGVTLAEVDGPDGSRVVGYASWERGSGYGPDKVLTVPDLVALTPGAARALWRAVGTFAPVTGRIRVSTSEPDTTRLVLPGTGGDRVATHPYMLRVLDLPGAVAPRTFTVDGRVDLAVAGDVLGLVDGSWRLEVSGGVAQARRTDGSADAPTLSVQGLALLYAGTLGTANLRLAGHLTGPAHADTLLDLWFGGRQVHVRDSF
ncbi:GNAT family N-acetyltransferase [Nocardioides zeae]|uniref:GNAT family N-acetyltransferase n=1 Tax=Nocardioides imazamoxiresistens TaxID=3231893 RepID=A0ABU3PY65_9ACTN|nr:GNAT family N-acetyltransferase [Nocardioides zeae]MDT9594174.1 GNAT family N-acetyltransferase [Nocardioides zeae]